MSNGLIGSEKPLRILNNGQRKLLLRLANHHPDGVADLYRFQPRMVIALRKYGLARESDGGLRHHITLRGWIWIARAILLELPAEVTTPGGEEARGWADLAERLDMTDVVYHGTRGESTAIAHTITVEDFDGEVLGTLRHVVRHSPDGPNWGYGGFGPADCARSLLITALGDTIAKCRNCFGSRRIIPLDPEADESVTVAFDPHQHDRANSWPCDDCDGGYCSLPYQDFKADVVANFGATWIADRASILAWLEDRLAGTNEPELDEE